MPDGRLLDLLALHPGCWVHGAILLGFLSAACALLRSALLLEAVLSRSVHAVVCVLTVLPPVVMGLVLVLAASQNAARAWLNLGVAAAVLGAWALGGLAPRLVRPDADVDPRWWVVGACITFPAGIVAAFAFS
jgi:hypothetical protein